MDGEVMGGPPARNPDDLMDMLGYKLHLTAHIYLGGLDLGS